MVLILLVLAFLLALISAFVEDVRGVSLLSLAIAVFFLALIFGGVKLP